MLDVADVLTYLTLTDENIEDLVGAMLLDTLTIDLTYNDTNGTIAADLIADLDDLADVDAAAPTDQFVLTWVAGNGAWEAQITTDVSTAVTLAGALDYLTLSGQEITLGAIDLDTDVSGTLPIASGGTGAQSAANARIALGLGTAAVEDIGTSGATVPLLDGANTWSGTNGFDDDFDVGGTLLFVDVSEGLIGLGRVPDGAGGVFTVEIENNLFITRDGAGASVLLRGYKDSAGSNPVMIFDRARGSVASPTALHSGDDIGEFRVRGHDGDGFDEGGTIFNIKTTEAWDATGHGMMVEFKVTPIGATSSTVRMTIDDDVTVNSGDLNLTSGGVHIGGSGAANYLDAYETGTWTPTVQDSSFSDAEGQVYGSQIGEYQRIGDTVYYKVRVRVTSLGTLTTTDPMVIAGLPFTTASNAGGGSATVGETMALPSASNYITAQPTNGQTYFRLRNWDNTGGVSNLLLSEFGSSGDITIVGSYVV
jgi:hypothetical protein